VTKKKHSKTPQCAKPESGSRRRKPSKAEKELYKLPDIQSFIEKERRHDELSRLKEVQQQNSAWIRTIAICASFNFVLIGLAVWGMYK